MFFPYKQFQDIPVSHEMRIYGDVTTGEIDVPFMPFYSGTIESFGVFLQESGSSGQTRVNVLLCSAGDPTGTTIFTGEGAQAIISSGGGEDFILCPDTNFVTTTFTNAQWFKFVVEEKATDAKNLYVALYIRLDRF